MCTWYNWLMHLDLILLRAGWSPSETQHDHSPSQNAYPYRDRRCWPWQHLRLQGFSTHRYRIPLKTTHLQPDEGSCNESEGGVIYATEV